MSTEVPGANLTGQKQVNRLSVFGRRLLTVVRVEEVTPKLRRIVLGGDDLGEGFPFAAFAPADHVKLFFPNPETGRIALPVITPEGRTYPEGAGEPIFRDYTVRGWDAEAKELRIDFVVHEHGVAGRWARDAAPGDELGVLGPKGNVLFPQDYPRYIVAGDETALPAISRVIEEAPAAARVDAVIEVADAAEEQTLTGAADIAVRWVHRDSASVGEGHGSALETAVRELPLSPDERVFVFVAGEATALAPIRRYLRRDLGLSREQADVSGYWKRGFANLDHHSPELTGED